MCGIVGYIGRGQALDRVLGGLRRLEYRGYDSAGIAVVNGGSQFLRKRAGKLARLEELLVEDPLPPSHLGIGHTRWATHGAPSDFNAHPHISSDGRIAVIHNGIIENFAELREELIGAGVQLNSETDSEVAAHLIERELVGCGCDLPEAVRRVCLRLTGAFTLVVTDAQAPDLLVGARRNSPLVAGVGEGEMFLASDVSAFIEHTRQA
ncbi:MAG: glutamine--fructose-6-phosphate aminotransferase, partial [Candidatus Nanopelagicales bacterium]|nr:glutamine--fructose-6-phosphate aminotransferase [Candidatus Nanopelagicales bacterium]